MSKKGREAPAEFYNQPEVEPHLVWLWDAFWELGTERQLGMSIGPIPVSKIREYLRDELELDGVEFERAKTIIRKADTAWIGMLNRIKDDEPEMAEQVKTTDTEGVKRVVRGLGDRATKRRK